MTGSEDNVTSNGALLKNRHGDSVSGDDQHECNDRTVPVYPPSPGKRRASTLSGGAGAGDVFIQPQQDITHSRRGISVNMHADEHPAEAGASGTSPRSSSAPQPPSIDEQVQRVTEIVHQPFREGERGYVVSAKWLARVLARSSTGQKSTEYDKSCREGEVGPIDNSDLVSRDRNVFGQFKDEEGHPFIPLKPGLGIGTDFEILPEEAWNLIVSWYGNAGNSLAIIRYAHDTAPEGAAQENIQYELYPLIFTIRKLRNDSAGTTTQIIKESSYKAARVLASRSELFQSFLKEIKTAAHVDMKIKVQVWRVIDVLPAADSAKSGMLTPASSRGTSPDPGPVSSSAVPSLHIDVQQFTTMVEGEQREMLDMKDETMNEKYNGHLRLSTIGFAENQTLILEEQLGGPGGGEWVSESVRKTAAKNGISLNPSKTGTQNKLKPITNVSSGRATPTYLGPVTRGRKRKDGRTRGTVGLTNLGNTCYMNSALQCVRSIEELALYFLQGNYKHDINSDNALGYGGSIAKSYASFVHSIYSDDSLSSFAPKVFRNTIGRFQPLFSGYGQQDSQEFLSFLVDALHEDLNRIRKKPYIENPESDDKTVHDPEAIRALGANFQENYRARNDSIAMDLFNGFYKNTMICPMCDKVSITFDPFSLLTLQLPIENTWSHDMIIWPLYRRPFKLSVDLNNNATFRSLKEYVAKKVPGSEADKLFIAEIYNHKFYKIFADSVTLTESSIQNSDTIVVYELDASPTNLPLKQQKKPGKLALFTSSTSSDEDSNDADSPAAARMIVPFFNRYSKPGAFQNSRSFTGWPSVILLTREEARDYESILKKVLVKIATMTTRPILSEGVADNENAGSQEDSDTVLTTEEDASSQTGPKVNTKSVDGEDGLVDVSMNDVTASTQGTTIKPDADEQQTLRKPELLQPGSFIPPMLQNLFEMKYFRSESEDVPTGWSSMSETTEYPTIASRIRTADRRSSTGSSGSRRRSTNADYPSDMEELSGLKASRPRRSLSIDREPDSGSEGFPTVEELSWTNRRVSQTKRSKPKTYSNKRRSYARSQSDDDNQPLVRLKEGIILDWNVDAYDGLFGGDEEDEMRGQATFDPDKMEYLQDPELDAKRATRAVRKKKGVSLDDCFTETARSEVLSEENAWYCSRCKELRRASKTLEIWTVPDILVLHLKRFSANRGFRDKIDVLVDFPVEGLDLSGKVGEPEGKELVYDLFAVDNHYGGLGGGHYTAYAKNFYDDKWYEYNDSIVSQTRPESVVTTAAYLLFYRRRSSVPLGPPYLQQIVEEAHNTDFEPTSRSTSPAGDDTRLGGSSLNGSSSGLHTGAVNYSAVDGLAGELEARSDNQLVRFNPDDDEGIALNDDEVLPDYNNALQGPPVYNAAQQWSFSRLDDEKGSRPQNSDDEDIPDDAASDKNAGGSDLSADLSERLLEDFGDDVAAHTGTPLGISQPPTPDGDEASALHIGAGTFDEDDAPVAEVRLDLEKPDDFFGRGD